MLEQAGTSEVEGGEEDEIVMVRVSGEEGSDDNPSRTNKELNKEPLCIPKYKAPLQSARWCYIYLHRDALRSATARPSRES